MHVRVVKSNDVVKQDDATDAVLNRIDIGDRKKPQRE